MLTSRIKHVSEIEWDHWVRPAHLERDAVPSLSLREVSIALAPFRALEHVVQQLTTVAELEDQLSVKAAMRPPDLLEQFARRGLDDLGVSQRSARPTQHCSGLDDISQAEAIREQPPDLPSRDEVPVREPPFQWIEHVEQREPLDRRRFEPTSGDDGSLVERPRFRSGRLKPKQASDVPFADELGICR
jgi:hypothetical protein